MERFEEKSHGSGVVRTKPCIGHITLEKTSLVHVLYKNLKIAERMAALYVIHHLYPCLS